jgi:4a-hydroxytetrahydrobiopterin dehydratase
MTSSKRLSVDERRAALDQLGSGWVMVEERALTKRWTFDDFAAALAFVVRVGAVAEAQQHHPDVAFGWGRAELTLTTHDAGGITAQDLQLAASIDALGA